MGSPAFPDTTICIRDLKRRNRQLYRCLLMLGALSAIKPAKFALVPVFCRSLAKAVLLSLRGVDP
jgi:hypothetical protein